jgi:Spy/CpxP family protein refolding chaperone
MKHKLLLSASLLALALGGIQIASAYYGSGDYGPGPCRNFNDEKPMGYGPYMGRGPGMGAGQGMGGGPCMSKGFGRQHGPMMRGPGMMGHRGGMRGMMMAKIQQLDLSQEQRDQLRDLMTQNHEGMQELAKQRRENRQQLREMMQSGDIDDAKVASLADSQASITKAKILKRAGMKKQVLALLTDEQKAQLKDMGPAQNCRGSRW